MIAQELRIGNLILRAPSSDYKEWKETTVNVSYLELIQENPDGFKPIPLDERWLKKAGANKTYKRPYSDKNAWINDGIIWSAGALFKELPNGFIEVTRRNYFDTQRDPVEFVHEYQNAMKVLTGNELEFNPQTP